MPQPTIDFNEIADGVTAVLNERAHGAQRAQREAEALRVAEAQRADEAAKEAQKREIENQWSAINTRLSDVIARRAASIETGSLHRIAPELWPTLESEYTNIMRERSNLQARFPWLKG